MSTIPPVTGSGKHTLDPPDGLLRIVLCGSVDDGKSTLIGRVLCDADVVPEDRLQEVQSTVKEAFDPSLLSDGLQAEREQGITIDVAYHYFATDKRSFVIADSPGHEEYTRNMATAASTADAAVLLIDARQGLTEQTRRHAFIASLFGVEHLIVAVNKMDLVEYDQSVYEKIHEDILRFTARLRFARIESIPLVALHGDNVVRASKTMSWYQGGTLMQALHSLSVASRRNLIDFRFPVQYVQRAGDHRYYCGTVASGVVRPGDELVVLPSRRRAKVEAIETFDGPLDQAFPPLSVALRLDQNLNVGRGDILVHPNNRPRSAKQIEMMTVVLHTEPLRPGQEVLVRQGCTERRGVLKTIRYQTDLQTLRKKDAATLPCNAIGRCVVTLDRDIIFDTYDKVRALGCCLLIDPQNNATLAGGVIVDRQVDDAEENATPLSQPVSLEERQERYAQKPHLLWITGAPDQAAEVAIMAERLLFRHGKVCVRLPQESLQSVSVLLDAGLICIVQGEGVPLVEHAATWLHVGQESAEADGCVQSGTPQTPEQVQTFLEQQGLL